MRGSGKLPLAAHAVLLLDGVPELVVALEDLLAPSSADAAHGAGVGSIELDERLFKRRQFQASRRGRDRDTTGTSVTLDQPGN